MGSLEHPGSGETRLLGGGPRWKMNPSLTDWERAGARQGPQEAIIGSTATSELTAAACGSSYLVQPPAFPHQCGSNSQLTPR
jgi:hypothetical protein